MYYSYLATKESNARKKAERYVPEINTFTFVTQKTSINDGKGTSNITSYSDESFL